MLTTGHTKRPSVSSVASESSSFSWFSNKSKEREEPNFPAHIVDELSPNLRPRETATVQPQFPDHLYMVLPSADRLVTSSPASNSSRSRNSGSRGSRKDWTDDLASLSLTDDRPSPSMNILQQLRDDSHQSSARGRATENLTPINGSIASDVPPGFGGTHSRMPSQNGRPLADENSYEGDRSDDSTDEWGEFHPPQGIPPDAILRKTPSITSSKSRGSSRSKISMESKESPAYPMRLPTEVLQSLKQEEFSKLLPGSRPLSFPHMSDAQDTSVKSNFNYDISLSASYTPKRHSISSFEDAPAPAYPNFPRRRSIELGRRTVDHSDNESRHSVSSDYKRSSLRDSISSGVSHRTSSSLASAEPVAPSPVHSSVGSTEHGRAPPPKAPQEDERRWSSSSRSSSVGEDLTGSSRGHTAEFEEKPMRYPLPPNFPPNFPPRNSLIATIPAALIPSTAPKSESRPSGTTDSSETRNRRNSVSSRSIMSVLSQGTSSSSKTLSSFSDDDKEAWPQAQKLRKSSLSLMKSSSEITSSSSSPLRKHMSKVSMSSNGSALPSDSRDTITFHPSKGPFTVEKLDKFASATGWLNKYSTPTFGFTAKSWKKRYFILVDTIYFAFKSHDPAAVYFDHFELIPGTIAFVTDDHDPRLYVIKIMRPDGRIWYVQAEDEKYLKIWLTELKRVVARLRDASSFPRQSTESAAFGTTSGTDSTISASLPSTPRRSISSLPSISTAISSDSTSVFTHDGEITPTTPTISPPSSPPPRHASATQYFTSHSFATPPLPKQLLSRADSIGGTLSYGSSPESQYLAHDYVAERLHSKRPLSPTRSPQGTRRRASNYKTLSRILPPQLPPPMAALPAPPSPNFDGDDLPPPARPAPQLPLPPIPGSPTLPSPGGASVSSPASLTPTHSTFPSPRPSLQLDNGVFQSAINAVHDDQTEYSRGEDIRKMALSRIPAGSTEVLRRSSSARLVRSGGNAVDDGHVQVGAVDGEVEQ